MTLLLYVILGVIVIVALVALLFIYVIVTEPKDNDFVDDDEENWK
jgi:hypothetical protein